MPTITIDTEDLASASEIAWHLKVTSSAVSNWAKRDPTFPRPITTINHGRTPIYSLKAAINWRNQQENP